MTVNVQAFYRATDPGVALFINNAEIDKKYYIDFSPVRGGQVIKKLKKTILWSEGRPTCQLFTGHIGCGKSTELLRLKQQLEAEKFHVVYVDSTNNLHKDDVDITDILLNIVQEVSKSLESWKKLNLNEPIKFKAILKRAAELLQTEINYRVISGSCKIVGAEILIILKENMHFKLLYLIYTSNILF